MECRPYGDRGVWLTALSETERVGLLSELERALPEGCSEYVLGHESLLLVDAQMDNARKWLKNVPNDSKARAKKPRCHTVRVAYDGVDLKAVAKACGLRVAEVIRRHSAPIYTVRMMGFSPGFPYLDGLDPQLHLERRKSPRSQIAPGSVAIGGAHAGIYSVASPGGWHLLGRTDLPLFDLDAARAANPDPEKVFLLRVGDQVRFQPILDT